MVWITQQVCVRDQLDGLGVNISSPGRFSAANAFNLSLGIYGIAIAGCMIWWLLSCFGRRSLYLYGLFDIR